MLPVSGSTGSISTIPSAPSGGAGGNLKSTGTAPQTPFMVSYNPVNEPVGGADTFISSAAASSRASTATTGGGGFIKSLFKGFLDELREFLDLMFPPVASKS